MFIWTLPCLLRTIFSPEHHRGASHHKHFELVVEAAREQTRLLICGAGVQ